MQLWNDIVDTAMMGTDKKTLELSHAGPDFEVVSQAIKQADLPDKEEQFLQWAAFAFNYKQCGFKPLQKPELKMEVAEPEAKPYASAKAHSTLKDIIRFESNSLLNIWLSLCQKNQQLASPEFIPELLYIGAKQKQLREAVIFCCGKRGLWLAQFNQDWYFTEHAVGEDVWHTGTTEQRKLFLMNLRERDPESALNKLKEVWQTEGAANRLLFLQMLETNLSDKDIEWLESILNDKGQKVKEEALRLLKSIPTSKIIKSYCELLAASWQLRKEKVLFGLTSKQVLEVHLPEKIDDDIFKSGIEKLSNRKEYSDEEFIVFQLLQQVPPSFLASHFQKQASNFVRMLDEEEQYRKWIPAIIASVIRFQDTKWAIAFMQYSSVFYLDIIPLLPPQQQEYYSKKYFKGNEAVILQQAVNWSFEWSTELAKLMIEYTAANPYAYNRSFYRQNIHLFPSQILVELKNFQPKEEYASQLWTNISQELEKLLTLKQEIYQSFT